MTTRSGRAWALGLAAAALAGTAAPALARGGGSLAPPGGQVPATAPGGTEGLAGPRNVEDAVRGGNAYRVGPDGIRRVRHPPPGYGYDPYRR